MGIVGRVLNISSRSSVLGGLSVLERGLSCDVIESAASVDEALYQLATQHFDLVAVDANEFSDDPDACRLDGLERAGRVPVVCVYTSPGELASAAVRTGGAHGHLVLPSTASELEILVRTAVASHARENGLQTVRDGYEWLLNSTSHGLVSIDTDWNLVYLNRAAQALLGRTEQAAKEEPLEAILSLRDANHSVPHNLLRRKVLGEGQTVDLYGHTLVLGDGRRLPVNGTIEPIRDAAGDVVGAVASFSDEQRHLRLVAQINRRNFELDLLRRLGKAFNSTLELGEVICTVLDEVRYLLDARGASIWLVKDEVGDLVCWQSSGPKKAIVRNWRLKPGQGLAGWVLERGVSLLVDDTQTDGRHFKGVDKKTGFDSRSVLSVPLKVADQTVGVLQLVDNRVSYFNQEDLRLVEAVAAEASIAIQNSRLHVRSQRLAVEQERNRLARELHDSVTQSLYGIGLTAASALKMVSDVEGGDNGRLQEAIRQIRDLAQQSLQEMREWVHELRPENSVDQDLEAALTRQCDLVRNQFSLQVDLNVAPDLVVPADFREAMFGIAREALWNVVRHASATTVAVSVSRDHGHVVLRVVDNGKGFETESGMPAGNGMENMRQRAQSLGGNLEIRTQPGSGTEVWARLPEPSPLGLPHYVTAGKYEETVYDAGA